MVDEVENTVESVELEKVEESKVVDYNVMVKEFGWIDPELVTYTITEWGEDEGCSILINLFLGEEEGKNKGLILELGHYYDTIDEALEWVYQHTITEEVGLEVEVWDGEGNQRESINLTEWVEEYYE